MNTLSIPEIQNTMRTASSRTAVEEATRRRLKTWFTRPNAIQTDEEAMQLANVARAATRRHGCPEDCAQTMKAPLRG
jgi:hypothetical protein